MKKKISFKVVGLTMELDDPFELSKKVSVCMSA